MNMLLIALALPVVAQTAEQAPLQRVLEVEAGGVTAVFQGEPVPPGIEPTLGIRRLVFRFADGSEFPFAPRGTLYFSDWFTDIFSPDGRFVLLPQDHYGPFHVVEVTALDAYLGGGPPFAVVGQNPGVDAGAWVHADARWVGDTTVVYEAGLEDLRSFTFELPVEQSAEGAGG